jgi:hypothetical protein
MPSKKKEKCRVHRWGRNPSKKEGGPKVVCVHCKIGFDAWQKQMREEAAERVKASKK